MPHSAGSVVCPFAPRATGNIATGDLVFALERSATTPDSTSTPCIRAGEWLGGPVGSSDAGIGGEGRRFPGVNKSLRGRHLFSRGRSSQFDGRTLAR